MWMLATYRQTSQPKLIGFGLRVGHHLMLSLTAFIDIITIIRPHRSNS